MYATAAAMPSKHTYRTFLQQQQKFTTIARNRYFDEEMFFSRLELKL